MSLGPSTRRSILALLAVSAATFGCAAVPAGESGGSGGDTSSSSGGSGPGGQTTGGSSGGSTGSTGTGGSTGSTGTGGATGHGGSSSVGGSTGSSGVGGATGHGGSSGVGGSTGSSGVGGSTGSTGVGGSSGSCAGTLMMCSGSCVDTTGSQNNCGGCGKACRADETCWQSACKCPTGQGDCGGSCKDIMASTVNCGTCGNACATGATCVTGVCQCPTGQTACSSACTDENTDGKNCGSCGKVCASGTSCLFGACLDPTSLTCTPSAQANKTPMSAASITLGKYWINNNEWGASSGSGTQSIWSTCQQGDLIGWGTSWSWTGTTNAVKSYASSILGWQWGWKLTNAAGMPIDTGLPLQISSGSKLNCGWSFNFTQSGGSADVAYDIFAHAMKMPGTNDNPTDEIMIWLYTANGAGPIGTKQATVTIDSASWNLYRGMSTWNVFSYVRATNATSAVVNVMDFMNDLVSRGWMQTSKYVTSVQSGTEIFTGTGELDTTGYYCRVQ